jgi:sterol 3beta-glucosyltransferase
VSSNFVGFWSKTFTQSSIRYRLPISIIKEVNIVNSKLRRFYCMAIALEGQSDLLFDFKTTKLRDQAIENINAALEKHRSGILSPLSPSESSSLTGLTLVRTPTPMSISSHEAQRSSSTNTAVSRNSSLQRSTSPHRSATGIISPLSRTVATVLAAKVPDSIREMFPKAINVPPDTLFIERKMHFVCLTIGSRGDVQPYIALALGLKKEGHRVTIVTHEEYKEWVVGFNIEHRTAGGDPGALMKLSVENKVTCPLSFYNTRRYSPTTFRCSHQTSSRRA